MCMTFVFGSIYTELWECLLPFGPSSFVFQFALQKYEHKNIHNYNFWPVFFCMVIKNWFLTLGEEHRLMVFIVFAQQMHLLGKNNKIYKMHDTYIYMCVCVCVCVYIYIYIYIYIGFKTLFYVVRRLDSTASYLPVGLHLGFFRSWPSLYLPSSFSFGLSRALLCFGIHFNAILGNLPSTILWTWPYHVSWFCSLSFTIVSSSPICCLIVTFLILSFLDILEGSP